MNFIIIFGAKCQLFFEEHVMSSLGEATEYIRKVVNGANTIDYGQVVAYGKSMNELSWCTTHNFKAKYMAWKEG